MNVVIYARYSSHNQTECSIDGQLKVCYEYAKQNDLTVIHEYIDRAITGTTDNREQFQKMLTDSEKQQFQGVLVYQLDRFGRGDIQDALNENKLNKNGVEVISAKENFSKDPSGQLLKGVIRSVNQYYSNELSVKVKRGMDLNADKCYYNGGSVPLGLKLKVVEELNGPFGKKIKKKKYVIDKEKAPIIKKIFEMYINDHTMFDIIRYLNAQHLKTSQDKEFNKNSIRTILTNKKYIGIYSYNGEETKGGIPRIIDDETFYKAQEKLSSNRLAPARKRAKTQYLLTTKLFCGNCKSMMVGVSGTSQNGKLHTYYSCKGSWKQMCRRKNIPQLYIEDMVVRQARRILTKKNIDIIANAVVEYTEQQNDELNIERLKKLLAKNKKEKDKLLDSLKECDIDIVKTAIFEEIKKVEEERLEIESQLRIEESNQINITVPQVKAFLELMRNGKINDFKYRQMLINMLVYKVYVYDDNITVIFTLENKQISVRVPDITKIESSYLSKSPQPKSGSASAFAEFFLYKATP